MNRSDGFSTVRIISILALVAALVAGYFVFKPSTRLKESEYSSREITFNQDAHECGSERESLNIDILADGQKLNEVKFTCPASISDPVVLAKNNEGVYFSISPDGLGGYGFYNYNGSFYYLDFSTNTIKEFGWVGDIAISSDFNKAVFANTQSSNPEIVVFDRLANSQTTYDIPAPIREGEVARGFGEFTFSPNNEKVAFGIGYGPQDEHGEIYILDLKTGDYTLIAEASEGIPYVDSWNGDKVNWDYTY